MAWCVPEYSARHHVHHGPGYRNHREPRAEQETLLGLQTRRLTLQQQLAAMASQAEHDRKYYNALEITSQQYQDAYEVRKRYAQKALKAESGAAGARLADARETLARNLELFRQGAVSEAVVASSRAQLASLQADAETIRSRVHINDGDLNAAKDQVYLDPEQLRMFDLKSQMTTLKLSLDNLERNRVTLEEELSHLDQLIESEQNRVQMMAAYNVVAYASGTVQELIAPQGTLRAQQIAVFPERMASRIDRDSELQVSIRGVAQPLKAKVVQLLSSPTDVQSSNYSVPFPYAEQNSVYVVGTFDNNLPADERLLTCNPGNWVTATVSR